MNGAGIAAKVRFGYAKAGQKLGLPHNLFRPTGPLTPALSPENRLRVLPFLTSESPDGGFKRPSKHGEPTSYGLFDASLTRPGDYVSGPTGTWFIASAETDAIPMVVQCNAVVTVSRDGGVDLAHEDGYSASLPHEDTYGAAGVGASDAPPGDVLLRSWPASLLFGGRTQQGAAELPTEVGMKGFIALLPAWPGLIFKPADRLVTKDGMAFTLGGAELSPLGWRLDCTASIA